MSDNKRGAPKGNKNAQGNRGGSRPSKYKPEFSKQAEKLCLLGATDKELADFFNVSEMTLNTWKKKEIEFSLAIKAGKLAADAQVAEKLFQRATGYAHKAVKFFPKFYLDPKTGDLKPVSVSYVERFPPDTAAAIFWLRNRAKNMWRDKPEDFEKLTDEQLDQIIERLKKTGEK